MTSDEMFRPPVNRAMRVLDRSFFNRVVPLSAARVFDSKDISNFRSRLSKSKDALVLDRTQNVRADPDEQLAQKGKRCILLRPDIRHYDRSTWSDVIKEKVEQEKTIALVPYALALDYDYWTYDDILASILPEDYIDREGLPSSFSIIGHVAHLNLRDHALPYKQLIAQVLRDKNPRVRTVINKIQHVGEEDEFRTFAYEVLAGPDDMNVTVSEGDCIFKFDYSKVYWNTRLQQEHLRMINSFKPGQAVCDVMAGIGPFAVPAGKREVFVWANDLNPESYRYLSEAVAKNKVAPFVRPFNIDGRDFIKTATRKLFVEDSSHSVEVLQPKTDTASKKQHRKEAGRNIQSNKMNGSETLSSSRGQKYPSAVPKTVAFTQPRFFSHFVLNLPASALSFLPSFISLYSSVLSGDARQNWPRPLIHVYTFSIKPARGQDNSAETARICKDVSELLQYDFRVGKEINEGEYVREEEWEEGQIRVHDVRDVAPNKRMFCVSFRLPEEVAWRKTVPA